MGDAVDYRECEGLRKGELGGQEGKDGGFFVACIRNHAHQTGFSSEVVWRWY